MHSTTCSPFILLLLQFCLLLPSYCSDSHSWNYKLEDHYGPSHWQFQCKGENQSPINIASTGLTSITLPPLEFSHYDLLPSMAILRNNGHTAKLSTKPATTEETPLMSGGGLPHNYKFSQVHFHWGSSNDKGSEHLIADTAYPMEMHLVHFKATHSSIKEALAEGAHDSLAVLGLFFTVSDEQNPALANLMPHFENIKAAETEIEATPFPISSFLTGDLSSFYRYNGSLTTPGCNEIVQWTVVKDPLPVSVDQLEAFRNLATKESQPLVDNFRPAQKLGSRHVLDVSTAQVLQKGSHSDHSSAVSERGMGITITMVLVAIIKMVSL